MLTKEKNEIQITTLKYLIKVYLIKHNVVIVTLLKKMIETRLILIKA